MKSNINEDFFKSFSEKLAAFIGFFFACGSLYKNQYIIDFDTSDKKTELLFEYIKDDLFSHSPSYISRGSAKGVILHLRSILGGNEKSSEVDENYIPEISKIYEDEFIFGYLCGVKFSKDRKIPNKKVRERLSEYIEDMEDIKDLEVFNIYLEIEPELGNLEDYL